MAAMASMASKSNSRIALAGLLLASLTPIQAWSGDWKFASGIALSERYSDNVNLAATGLEQSNWITEFTPRLSVRRAGARLKANADYSLQGLLYADGTNSSKVRHNLNALANAELVKEWFYLDAGARMSQELLSLNNGIGLGDSVGIGNTTSVGGYTLSPYLKHRLGSAATVEARVSLNGVFIGNGGLSDTTTTRYKLSAVSGNDFLPLSWGANYNRSDTRNSGATNPGNSGSEQASVNARYSLSKKFGLLANASMEKNDFTGVSTSNIVRDYSSYGLGMFYTPSRYFSMDALYNQSDNGDFLSGSVTLNPTLRTSISATSSKRAYGRSYGLNLTHRTRQSNWSLRYQDDLTTSQQQFLNPLGNLVYYDCPTGPEPYVSNVEPSSPACLLKAVALFNPVLVNQTYLSKTLSGTVSYTLRRNTWMLNLFDTRREFQNLGGGNDTTRGLQASWSLRPAAHTTFTLTGGMSKVESSTGNRQDDLWNLGLVTTHQFQPKVSGSVEARHQERKSNQAGSDFSENSVAARMNMTF